MSFTISKVVMCKHYLQINLKNDIKQSSKLFLQFKSLTELYSGLYFNVSLNSSWTVLHPVVGVISSQNSLVSAELQSRLLGCRL